jgi:hypothetical protein
MAGQLAFKGDTWRAHLAQLQQAVPDLEHRTILDFGCGPKAGLAAVYPGRVIPYDPYVEQFATPPWNQAIDVVFSSDVLEHMPLQQIRGFLAKVRDMAPSFVFLVASTRHAQKLLPNGSNAHLTVKPPDWWLNLVARSLGHQYSLRMATADLLRQDVTLCFARDRSEGSNP